MSRNDAIKIGDIFDNPLHVILIKKFIAPSVIKNTLEAFKTIPNDAKIHTPRGFIAPCSFAQISDVGIEQYINSQKKFKSSSGNFFHPIQTQLEDFFLAKKGDWELESLTVASNDVQIESNLYSFRNIREDVAGMHIHCHNQLHELNPDFARNIPEKICTDNDVSFFISLQKPIEGGELEIFDVEWQSGQRNFNNDFVIQPNGSYLDLKSVKSLLIPMEPGDMAIFESGKTWHKIGAVSGTIPRITLGGFFLKSQSGNRLFYFT